MKLNEKSEHTNIFGLLPWYANGTLAAQDREMVVNHLGQCVTCQKYYADLKAINRENFEAVSQQDEWKPTPQGFAAIMDKIDTLEASPSKIAKLPQKKNSIMEWFRNHPNLTFFALGVETIALASLLLSFAVFTHVKPPEGVAFETLSNGTAQPPMNLPCYSIVFQSSITEEAMRNLLLKYQAKIRNGPSMMGAYSLQFGNASQEEVSQAIVELKALPQITFLEAAPQGQCQ